MPTAIGIDLGTTNSVAAYFERGKSRVLPARNGESLTPSVVSYYATRRDPEGKIVVGRTALDNAVRAPQDTVFSIKRLMGRAGDDPHIERVKKSFGYQVVASPDPGDPGVRVLIKDKAYTPVEISAMILRQIKEDAQLALGDEVTHAVITVPAYFEERQREATRQAGEQAGLIVKRIIDEPTASAIAFGAMQADLERVGPAGSVAAGGDRHRILVFDLGGGTFDISIVQIAGSQYQVLEISGDNWLGGDDFDHGIVSMIVDHVREKYGGYDPSADPRFMMFAKKYAEQAKIALSVQTEYELVVPDATRTPEGEIVDIEMGITREEFNARIQRFADHALDLVQTSLQRQNLKPEDITQVLLVGGSTAVPLIHDGVVGLFGKGKVRRDVEPMHCVGLGAAILAAKLRGIECPQCKELNEETQETCLKCGHSLAAARSVGDDVTSVTASTLGIAVVKGNNPDHFEPIIPKSTPYPLKAPKRRDFGVSVAGQKLIRIPVYEGESPIASRNSLQGIVEFDLPQGLSGDTAVAVSFNYDRNRVLTVTLRPLNTEIRLEKRLTRTGAYYEHRQAPQEEEEHDWRQMLEGTQQAAEQFVSRYGDYLPAAQKNKMEKDMGKVWDVVQADNETEGRRLQRALHNSIFGSGIASQMFLAERAMDGADPQMVENIQKAINRLKEAHQAKDSALVQNLRNVLQRMTEMVFQQRMAEAPVADREFENLLRVND